MPMSAGAGDGIIGKCSMTIEKQGSCQESKELIYNHTVDSLHYLVIEYEHLFHDKDPK